MRKAWNEGLSKETSDSVHHISETMRLKKIDNFKMWRDAQRIAGKIPAYTPLEKNGDLAELIGVILGDGSITKFPRTESLRIVGNSNNLGFAKRYETLVGRVFGKAPHVAKRATSNAINITIYQCHISKRLCIPTGAKGDLQDVLPSWIKRRRSFLIRYLRGLYEAEGSYCVHEPTYTHKFLFSNTNPALLEAVCASLESLGFHPHRSPTMVQISRKDEVQNLKNLLKFRSYDE